MAKGRVAKGFLHTTKQIMSIISQILTMVGLFSRQRSKVLTTIIAMDTTRINMADQVEPTQSGRPNSAGPGSTSVMLQIISMDRMT